VISERTLIAFGVGALCGCAVLSALLEMLLVPLYVGSTLVPIAVVFAVAGNITLPVLAKWLVPTGRVMLAPFFCWLVPVIVLVLFPRPEGDVILPGGGGGVEWVGYGVLLGGIAAGIATVITAMPAPERRPPVSR
jgi:hypothetical protein